MPLRLAYLSVTNAFAMLRLLPRSNRDKDTEILALRHQITVLQRQLGTQQPRFDPSDRALLAALLYRLPRDVLRELRLLIRPDTVLRWHRDLVARRHATASRPKRPGRPRTTSATGRSPPGCRTPPKRWRRSARPTWRSTGRSRPPTSTVGIRRCRPPATGVTCSPGTDRTTNRRPGWRCSAVGRHPRRQSSYAERPVRRGRCTATRSSTHWHAHPATLWYSPSITSATWNSPGPWRTTSS
jgi:hypothetical protein